MYDCAKCFVIQRNRSKFTMLFAYNWAVHHCGIESVRTWESNQSDSWKNHLALFPKKHFKSRIIVIIGAKHLWFDDLLLLGNPAKTSFVNQFSQYIWLKSHSQIRYYYFSNEPLWMCQDSGVKVSMCLVMTFGLFLTQKLSYDFRWHVIKSMNHMKYFCDAFASF